MKPTIIMADLHLDLARPNLLAMFTKLLASAPLAEAKEVYILGDLVEAWVGDDDDSELPDIIAHTTNKLAATGVPIYFMHGNRDFLLGHDFAARAGMELIEKDAIVRDIQGIPTLLMHGDTLCTDDTTYQQIRAKVRTPEWRAAMLAKPLTERRAFAAQSRQQSMNHTGGAAGAIMDVNQQAVRDAMREAGIQRLIHGHTHRPAIHHFSLNQQPATRIVVGDWYQHGSVLLISREEVSLRAFMPNQA